MGRISKQINQCEWKFEIVVGAIRIVADYFHFPWKDKINLLINEKTFAEDEYYLEQITHYLLHKGSIFLNSLQKLTTSIELQTVASLENSSPNFAREMSKIRRNIALIVDNMGYNFPSEGSQLNLCLGKLWKILQARNANPETVLLEENWNRPVADSEREYAQFVQEYVTHLGWQKMPYGEREEAILCLSQHLYSLGQCSKASDFLVDAMETTPEIHDPVIYYNYFVLGITAGEFTAAMEGYHAACQANSDLAMVAVDNYQIEEVLARERIFASFVAQDIVNQETVVIKRLNSPDRQVLATIATVMQFAHEGIASILEFDESQPSRPCIIMEYLQGPSLSQLLAEQGPLPIEQWLPMAIQITEALAYAHERGVVHGYLNPDNLVLHQGVVKITDFGLSPLINSPLSMQKTDFQAIHYIAPEQLQTLTEPKMTGDIYSLTKILYALLTGESPDVMILENIAEKLRPIFRKGTIADIGSRYQKASELLTDLTAIREQPLAVPAQPKKIKPTTTAINKMITLDDEHTLMLPENFVHRNGVIYSQIDEAPMVLIPEGSFTMGSEERPTESPVHQVLLQHYLIDECPVTNGQYANFLAYVEHNGDEAVRHPQQPEKSHIPTGWQTPEYKKYSEGDDCPVVFIDWWDAWAYATWAKKQLPTEAQWEKAARGIDSRKYPWGYEEANNNYANFGNSVGKTSPVGSFSGGVSPYGVMDMAGNVWEWTLDNYDKVFYRTSPAENPVCDNNKPARSLRGGSWKDGAPSLRTTARGCWIQSVRYENIGFRCTCYL